MDSGFRVTTRVSAWCSYNSQLRQRDFLASRIDQAQVADIVRALKDLYMHSVPGRWSGANDAA